MLSLSHDLVTAPDVEPRRWMAFLHGIYGRGGNWRSIARKLSALRPDWGYVLVDLRMHGGSQGAAPPHTVAAAAEDVGALAGTLGDDGRPLMAVCGHSFGGKVALELRRRALVSVTHTFVLDSTPAARDDVWNDRDETVVRVLELLGALTGPFTSRDDFIGEVERRGFGTGLGQWLAMNLERRAHGYELVLDPEAMRALLEDYFARDLWDAVAADAGPGTLDVIVAGQSTSVSEAERERLRAIAAASGGVVRLDEIADAGHWLHVDAGDELVELLAARLAEPV